MTEPNLDHFDKITLAMDEAEADCKRAYIVWNDACARHKRLQAMQREVWLKMLDGVVNGELTAEKPK